MLLPTLAVLREAHPRAQIHVLARDWVVPVLECSPVVDQILPYDRTFHRTRAGRRELISQLRRGKYDAVIIFQNAFEAAWVMARAQIPIRVGFSVEGRGWLLTHKVPYHTVLRPIHRILRNMELIRTLGIHSDKIVFPIELPEKIQQWASQWLKDRMRVGEKIVGVHPNASGGPARRWDVERFKELIQRLMGDGKTHVVLLGGATDHDLFGPLIEWKHPRFHSILGQTTLLQSMALMKRFSLLISNDSGPVHLAYAFDIPVVAIFGPTSPMATGPWGGKSTFIQAPVDCRPCFETHCPIDHRCMNWIQIEDVLRAAGRFIDFPSVASVS